MAENKLLRVLGLKESISMTIGTVVGVGLFTCGSTQIGLVGSWIIGFTFVSLLVSIWPCLIYGEMSAALPEAGGTYNFAKRGLNRVWANMAGWHYIVSVVAIGAGETLAFSNYFTILLQAIGFDISWLDPRIMACVLVGIFLVLNYFGIKQSGKAQTFFIFFFWACSICWFLYMIPKIHLEYFGGIAMDKMPPFKEMMYIFGLVWWCYTGFETCVSVGGETKYPQYTLPRALKISVLPISHLTVGDFRNWLLSESTTSGMLAQVAPAITPEMAAAVSKIMRNQDLMLVAQKCIVVTKFRDTIGLPGHLSVRLQPNHPVDDLKGIAASIVDGLMYGSGDAVIGINPASDSQPVLTELNYMLDDIIQTYEIPTQSCVLTHVTTCMEMIEHGAPVDLLFQSIAGTEAANAGFGINLKMLDEGYEAVTSLRRGTIGNNCMYFETGQGSALSSDANFGVDEQTCEARCYAVARRYKPLLVNTVVGFIGPEYLYDGKQITRAGLEDHFCGKLMGVPMGCDICYTNHAEADQDDMDNLLTLLVAAGVNYIMGIPGADDIMLNYQSTSYHDALYARKLLGKRHAPEFEKWLQRMSVIDDNGDILPINNTNRLMQIEHMEAVNG